MTNARTHAIPDAAALAAFAARLRVWLLQWMAWLLTATGVDKRLPAHVRRKFAAEVADSRRDALTLVIDRVQIDSPNAQIADLHER